MKLLPRILLSAAILAVCAGATTPNTPERITVAFSDPSRPGLLHVGLVTGNITVKGGNVKDVTVETHTHARGERWRGRGRNPSTGPSPTPRPSPSFGPDHDPDETPPGLHRLPQQPSISVEEQNNRMSIGSPSVNRPVDLEITVPAHTNLELSTVNDGNILVEGVDGEMEIGDVNGTITLNGVGGSVVAHTINGRVKATLARVSAQKPMAFTSLNGEVDVTLPAAAKANLKLRTDNGSVFTDFELRVLPQSTSAVVEDTRQSGGRYRVEVNKVIYGAINGGGPEVELRTFNGNVYVRKGS
jgi:hypothetical protein